MVTYARNLVKCKVEILKPYFVLIVLEYHYPLAAFCMLMFHLKSVLHHYHDVVTYSRWGTDIVDTFAMPGVVGMPSMPSMPGTPTRH